MFLNGLARGCLAADHELFFSRTRSQALKGADVALVIGVPMDFRLGFGGSFGEETEIIVIDGAEPERPHPRAVAAECYGAPAITLADILAAVGSGPLASEAWISGLRAAETERGRPSGSSLRMGVRRSTRCASMRSSARYWTATRS